MPSTTRTRPILTGLSLTAALSLAAAVTASALLTLTAADSTSADPGSTLTQAVVMAMGSGPLPIASSGGMWPGAARNRGETGALLNLAE